MTMDDTELKKMRFVFNLGKRMDDTGLTPDDLVTVLSGGIATVPVPRPERHVDVIGTEPETEPKTESLVEDGKGLVAVDRVSPTEDQDKLIRQNVHRYLMRTRFSKDLDTTVIGRIESMFYEGLDSKGHLMPAGIMMRLFERGLEDIRLDCNLVYGLRNAYRNAVRDIMHITVPNTTSRRPVTYRMTGKPSMKKLDKDGKIRRFILDRINSELSGEKIIVAVRDRFGVNLNQKQIYNVRYKNKIHKKSVGKKKSTKTEDMDTAEMTEDRQRSIIKMPEGLSDDKKLRIRKFIIARHKGKDSAKDIVAKVKIVFGDDISVQRVYDTAYEDRQRRKKKTSDRFNAKDQGDRTDKDKKKKAKHGIKVGVFMGKVNKVISR